MTAADQHREVVAGRVEDFAVGDRRMITVAGREIGVFRIDDGYVAYENLCIHQGGPVCTGRIFPRLTAEVDAGGRVMQERYDRSQPHLVCPWHGWEYDLRTGVAAGDRSYRLRSFPVRVEDGEVRVAVG